jgi:hypothetical protein
MGCIRIAGEICEEWAVRNGKRASERASVLHCELLHHYGQVKLELEMLTIDLSVPSVRLVNTAVGLTEELVDGRYGVVLVARSPPSVGTSFTQAMAIQMIGLDQPVHQFVTVDSNQVQFGAREWSSTPTLDLETGVFGGGVGSDSVCRRVK